MKLTKETLQQLPRDEQVAVLRQEVENLDLTERFTLLHELGLYHGAESQSGDASSLSETAALQKALPGVFQRWNIHRMLDLPCGDFYWMREVDFRETDYTGIDLVEDLVDRNNRAYGQENRRFLVADGSSDPLPQVDLVFCRDLLIHLSLADIRKVLVNIVRSRSRLLLVSHFTECTENVDIVSGDYHPVNLCHAPFGLPSPLEIHPEGSKLADGQLSDRAMALWRLENIAAPLGIDIS